MTNAQLARMPRWYHKYGDDLTLVPSVTWRMDTPKSTANTIMAAGKKDARRIVKVWKRLAHMGYVAVSESLQ